MAKFSLDKRGYNPSEVDDYINKMYLKYEDKLREQKDRVVTLKKEIESLNARLANYESKDEQISKALIYAVEKAEQIETNAKNVYNLEIKRLNALYTRWEYLLLEVEKRCPQVNQNGYISALMDNFKESIREVSQNGLTLDTKSIKEEIKRTSDDFIKNILNKMSYAVNSKAVDLVEQPKAKKVLNTKTIQKVTRQPKQTANTIIQTRPEMESRSYSSISSINERLKKLNLINPTNAKPSKTQSLADKYLNSDDDLHLNAYAKKFAKKKLEKAPSGSPFNFIEYPEPNESGFDLKDALNPKEDLDEIMKSFDFFDDEK